MTASGAIPRSDLPLVVAIEMGYGHMRPATALAAALGTPVHACDRAPLAGEDEVKEWNRSRRIYEALTRWSTVPGIGAAFRPLVRSLTGIRELHQDVDHTQSTWPVKHLDKLIRKRGMGDQLVEVLRETGRPLLTTYFMPALAADAGGIERIYLVVTDSDISRVWVGPRPEATRIQYLAPCSRVVRRLQKYGVPRANLHATGFPLPPALLGGPTFPTLRRHLAARLVRLDPKGRFRTAHSELLGPSLGTPLPEEVQGEPPRVTFAVGGAGAQTSLVRQFLPSLRAALDADALRLTLVAGIREGVEARMQDAVAACGLSDHLGGALEILRRDTLPAYFTAFDELMARTDVLWTKPSEVVFYGALGIPLVFSPPVGEHERYNQRWARDKGAGIEQRNPRHAGRWLRECLEDGRFAMNAWSGFVQMPKAGLYRCLDHALGRVDGTRGDVAAPGAEPYLG